MQVSPRIKNIEPHLNVLFFLLKKSATDFSDFEDLQLLIAIAWSVLIRKPQLNSGNNQNHLKYMSCFKLNAPVHTRFFSISSEVPLKLIESTLFINVECVNKDLKCSIFRFTRDEEQVICLQLHSNLSI